MIRSDDPGPHRLRRWLAHLAGLSGATQAGAAIVGTVVLCGLFAPLLTPYDPNGIDLLARLQPPSLQHLAGTDEVGRDLFARILFGARASLAAGLGVVIIGASLGALLGALAGFRGGWLEALLMRATDAVMALPGLVIALALTAVLGPSLQNAVLTLGLLTIPHYARLARSEALVIRRSSYVEASALMGASVWHQLRTNVLPNVTPTVLVYATVNIGGAMLAVASLSFVGLGAQPPLPEWGALVSAGRGHIVDQWWYPTAPGLAIAITILGFNLLGDGLRDRLDPRSRSRR